jgi:Carboxypeptidase regulatory-like domain
MRRHNSAKPLLCVAIAAASFSFLARSALAECVTIETVKSAEPYRLSRQNVRIKTILYNKAASGVKVAIYRMDGSNPYSLVSDKNGVVVAKQLEPGSYRVIATSDTSTGSLLLHVSRSGKKEMSDFFISLATPAPYARSPLSAAEMLSAMKQPVSAHVQQFNGVVLDPSGAPIPGADIAVTQTDPANADNLIELHSDQSGRFSKSLPEGTYVAIFRSQGFRDAVAVFEVTNKGTKDLQVKMTLGGC